MSRATKRDSASGTHRRCRCVDRGCPRTRQARRSETPRSCRAWSTAWRRRGGLRTFPRPPPSRSGYPAPDRPPAASAARSLARASSAASLGRAAGPRTPCANRSYVCSLTPSFLQTCGARSPRLNSTSARRSFVMICSVLNRLRGILPPGRDPRILPLGLERSQGSGHLNPRLNCASAYLPSWHLPESGSTQTSVLAYNVDCYANLRRVTCAVE